MRIFKSEIKNDKNKFGYHEIYAMFLVINLLSYEEFDNLLISYLLSGLKSHVKLIFRLNSCQKVIWHNWLVILTKLNYSSCNFYFLYFLFFLLVFLFSFFNLLLVFLFIYSCLHLICIYNFRRIKLSDKNRDNIMRSFVKWISILNMGTSYYILSLFSFSLFWKQEKIIYWLWKSTICELQG